MSKNKRFHYQKDNFGYGYLICDDEREVGDKVFAETWYDVDLIVDMLNDLNDEVEKGKLKKEQWKRVNELIYERNVFIFTSIVLAICVLCLECILL